MCTNIVIKEKSYWDFPSSPVVRILPSSARGTQVWSLFRELSFHMPWDMAKKTTKTAYLWDIHSEISWMKWYNVWDLLKIIQRRDVGGIEDGDKPIGHLLIMTEVGRWVHYTLRSSSVYILKFPQWKNSFKCPKFWAIRFCCIILIFLQRHSVCVC